MSTYQYFRSQGLCGTCGKEHSSESLCNVCKRKRFARMSRKINIHKAKGICTKCFKHPASSTSQFCTSCSKAKYESNKKYRKAIYERLKSQGICVLCGIEDARPGRVMCQECTDKEKQRAQQKLFKILTA